MTTHVKKSIIVLALLIGSNVCAVPDDELQEHQPTLQQETTQQSMLYALLHENNPYQNGDADVFGRQHNHAKIRSFNTNHDLITDGYKEARVECAKTTKELKLVIETKVEPLLRDIRNVFSDRLHVNPYGLVRLNDNDGHDFAFEFNTTTGHFEFAKKSRFLTEEPIVFNLFDVMATNPFFSRKWLQIEDHNPYNFYLFAKGVGEGEDPRDPLAKIIEAEIKKKTLKKFINPWFNKKLQNKIESVNSQLNSAYDKLQEAIAKTIEPDYRYTHYFNQNGDPVFGYLCCLHPKKVMSMIDNEIVINQKIESRIMVQIVDSAELIIEVNEAEAILCTPNHTPAPATFLQKLIIFAWVNAAFDAGQTEQAEVPVIEKINNF